VAGVSFILFGVRFFLVTREREREREREENIF